MAINLRDFGLTGGQTPERDRKSVAQKRQNQGFKGFGRANHSEIFAAKPSAK
jgi:hypothetical protein